MTSKIKPINATETTYERLKEIAQKTNMTQTALLKILVDELFLLVATIDQANIEFAGSQIDAVLKILVRDRNKVIVGEIQTTDADTDKAIREALEERGKP